MVNKSLSIAEIITIEPRLKIILKNARQIKGAKWSDYEKYKRQLCPLVGFWASKKELRSCNAYEVTIQQLTNALRI